MQRMIRENPIPVTLEVFREVEKLYFSTSDIVKYDPNSFINYKLECHNEFKDVVDLMNENGDFDYSNIEYRRNKLAKIPVGKYPKKNLILLFSGGKDSTAAAIKLKEMGYNIVLYHIAGLTTAYKNEKDAAVKIAKLLDLPIVIENVKLMGSTLYDKGQHPVTNMMIAVGALYWGIRNNFSVHIATGNFINSKAYNCSYMYDFGDSKEMWEAFSKVMEKYVDDYKLSIILNNSCQSIGILAEHKEILEETLSCVCTYRYRDSHRREMENHYHIKLMKNRCGCCWKCSMEYIYLADHNLIEYNQDYYMKCFNKLAQNEKKGDYIVQSVEHLWKCYFTYDIKESKALNVLNHSYVTAIGNICTKRL